MPKLQAIFLCSMDEYRDRALKLYGLVRTRTLDVLRMLKRKAPHLAGVLAAVTFFSSAWLYFGVQQPSNFYPRDTIITIPEGSSVLEVAEILRHHQVVRSAFAFRGSVALAGRPVLAGDYYFDEPQELSVIVERMIEGRFELEPVRITIPEGATTYRMADIFADKLQRFDPTTFLLLAEKKEGYLFPDTYDFLPTATASDVLTELERTFYERLQDIEAELGEFGRPLHEIVTMASLLEKEAWQEEDRHVIAGILWHRIEIGMPLQVDAVFGFIAGTETFSPTFSDLEVESPYNTYQNVGLPPGPIGSPSHSSLRAAADPIETEDLFYLHGRDGVLRTAQTYDGHLTNRRLYLD